MLPCNVKARKKSLKRRVAVDEGGDILGAIFDDNAEGEDEKGKEKEGEEIRCEGGGSFFEKLGRTAEVIEARMIVGHGGRYVGFAGYFSSTTVRV